jgi:hypothetical protein
MRAVIRGSIVVLGVGAAVMAIFVTSVIGLWFFTADLIFVLLVPQLMYTLFDPRANRTGSIVAFVVSLVLRLGGGEPLVGLPPLIPYPVLCRSAAGRRGELVHIERRWPERRAVPVQNVYVPGRHDSAAGRLPTDRGLRSAAKAGEDSGT